MPLFGQKPKFKSVAPPTIRIEKTVVVEKIKPKPSPSSTGAASSSKPKPKQLTPSGSGSGSSSTSRASKSASPGAESSSSGRPSSKSSLKRKGDSLPDERPARKSPAVGERPRERDRKVTFADDSSDSDGDDGDLDWDNLRTTGPRAEARRREAGLGGEDVREDTRRVLRNELSFLPRRRRKPEGGETVEHDGPAAATEGEEELDSSEADLTFVHAADVASLKTKCTPALGAAEDEVAVELQYPGSRVRERYELVEGRDMIDAVKEIIRVVKHVAVTYVPETHRKKLTDPQNGLIRRLEKASNRNVRDVAAFKQALREYNELILSLLDSGELAAHLDTQHSVQSSLVELVLSQVYDRVVAPSVDRLRRYENGTDNVYGELLHPFVSDILGPKQTAMDSTQLFVDLGSGVGNVALHAALEIGCEALGCEVMENACDLADAQLVEFAARCRLWGLRPGKVTLERGDFRTNAKVHEALKRADVVLVNNQAFTAQLNENLVTMFLDLKPGCRVVSLKSFVKSSAHNVNDVGATILDVVDLRYPEGYVSWTGAGGSYCIATRK